MKSFFFPCHMCGSYDSQILTPAFLTDGSYCNFQQIVICRRCGLVYKNPVIPDLNKFSYSKKSWGDGTIFKKRIFSSLMPYLSSFIKEISPKIVMEIGPGPGWLAISLEKLFPTSKYILFEASKDVAELTKHNLPNATVIPAAIDEVYIGNNFADLVIVCGVDYLFSDFRGGIEKIHKSLTIDGYLYIERNVFVETEAYVGFPIRTYKDLFGQNLLMTTWFAVDQYQQFLTSFFDIVSERSFILDEIGGFKCILHSFLCKKKSARWEYFDGSTSWYKTNMASLSRLEKNQLTRRDVNFSVATKLQNIFRFRRLYK